MSGLCAAVAVTLHLASLHTAGGYNNANYGAGASCVLNENVSVSTGIYRNSFDKATVYLTGGLETSGSVRVGVVAGIATGYRQWYVGGVTLAVDVAERTTLGVILAPTLDKSGAVIHFTLSRRL